MEFLSASQRDFLQAPHAEPSGPVLSRQALWRHDANHPLRPRARVESLLAASAAGFRDWLDSSVQEPEAEAWNRTLWSAHQAPALEDDATSLAPSCSGDIFQERERLAVYLALSDAQKAALCGWCSSDTAATRVLPFVQLSQKSSAEPSRGLGGRFRCSPRQGGRFGRADGGRARPLCSKLPFQQAAPP